MNAGTIIRETRRRYGMSQGTLGDMLGYERSSISNMEHNRKNVSEETLANVAEKLHDTLVSAMICNQCKQGGFIAGLEIPVHLDKHFAELHGIIHKEFAEMDAALEKYMDDVREAGWEQEQMTGKKLLKHAMDLLPLVINLALGLNQRCGIYHRDALREVNRSVHQLTCRQKEKELSKKTAP